MGKHYDDPRFGVNKILTFPGHCDCIAAAGNRSQMTFDEDVVLVEFGIVVTEAITGGGALATVQLRESSTVLGSITVPSASAIGTLITTVTLTTTAIDATDTLIFYGNLSCLTIGEVDGYVKYRERFKSG
jgi:hypothetical protein